MRPPPSDPPPPPPIALSKEDDAEEDAPGQLPSALQSLPGQPLLSGWVRLFAADTVQDTAPMEKVWLVVTDQALHVRFGRAALDADDVLSVSAVSAAPPPSKGYRVSLRVRKWKGPQPWLASPRGISPPERSSAPSPLRRSSESLLSLLSPLWRASRITLIQRGSSARLQRRGSEKLSGMQKQGAEYVLELDTSWEAEAWASAVGESREGLVRAAASERWADVMRLLRAGRDPDGREANGRSALHYASCHGSVETVGALVDAGASAACVDHTGLGPLGMAALQSQPDVSHCALHDHTLPYLALPCLTLPDLT